MHSRAGSPAAEDAIEVEHNEVAEVLVALEALLARVTTPIIRACLEIACEDIAHLTGRE